ncbi:hypothetical protein [Clostridium thermobutyricum]|uniref:hypothetical protein n=1 Tax=Clostridium thermobutyricum TaxID=29372 RepID=UPI0018A94E14|nr:hypothetical protein [Clostridium thermobutyricum]
MKNVHDFIKVHNKDDKNATHHEIEIHSNAEPHKGKVIKYFDKIDEKEVTKGNNSIYKDKTKSRLLIPRNAIELKTLIDDLSVILNS